MRDTDLKQWFSDYLSGFRSLDVDVVSPYYRIPMMVILQMGVMVLSNEDEMRSTFSLFFDQLRAADYARTELAEFDGKYLSQDVAEVGGVGVRYTSAGDELNRFLFRYVLRRDEQDWKIAVMINGDAPT